MFISQAGIGFFSSLEDAGAKAFADYAAKNDLYVFAYTSSKDVMVSWKGVECLISFPAAQFLT